MLDKTAFHSLCICMCCITLRLPTVLQTFLRGMYYSTYLRAAPQVRVLCLNTNLYAVKVRKAARALVQLDEENSSGLNASAAGVPIMRSALEDYAETADPG